MIIFLSAPPASLYSHPIYLGESQAKGVYPRFVHYYLVFSSNATVVENGRCDTPVHPRFIGIAFSRR